ncbi:MAG: hypothetical protein M1836_005579 [Candelina mexicana]|nr:MAG: hypothetical protein M1836_005579 [Candelina mexicana]
MDILQDYIFQLYRLSSPYIPLLISTTHRLQSYLSTLPLQNLNTLFTTAPDLTSLALLLLILFLSVKFLNMLRRAFISWLVFWIKVGFWAVVILLGVVVWQRGPEQAFRDLGFLWGEGEQVWKMEKRRWEDAAMKGGRGGAGFGSQGGGYRRSGYRGRRGW